jgi:dephospho-CoA kinase
MLIGITGTIGAGKGEVVDYLVNTKGFRHISARKIWTEELEARGLPIDRDTMTKFANEMRAEHGPAYFMERALATVENEEDDVVIESVRTISEAEMLHAENGLLLAIDADIKERYQRITGRQSALDDVSYEDFVRQEEAEFSNTDPNKQNLSAVITMADKLIENNGSIKALQAAVEEFISTQNQE